MCIPQKVESSLHTHLFITSHKLSAHYSISSRTVMFFSVIMYCASVVVFVYWASLNVQCRTDASIFNWHWHADCFWQFTKSYKVRLSSDNIVMCAIMFHCIIVNWTAMIVTNIHWISMDVQWTADTPVFYCTGSVQLSIFISWSGEIQKM